MLVSLGWVGFVWGSGCGGPQDAPGPPLPDVTNLDVFSVSVVDSRPVMEVRDSIPLAGLTFAVIDRRGYQGLVRVVGRERIVDCDHCGPLAQVEIVGGSVPEDGASSVGPVRDAPIRARMVDPQDAALGTGLRVYAPLVRFDLNGDGTIDIELVSACGSVTRSGCDGQVCDSFCTGVRGAGEQVPRNVHCRPFVADVEDCVPQERLTPPSW